MQKAECGGSATIENIARLRHSHTLTSQSLCTQNLVMRQDRRKIRQFVRPFVTAVVACLLFQQALALVFSQTRHSGDNSAFLSSPVALSDELCANKNDAGGKAPHAQHMHCLACFVSERSDDAGSKVLFTAVVLVLAPVSDAPPLWPEERDLAPPTTLWPSNRLSRAPPSLLS